MIGFLKGKVMPLPDGKIIIETVSGIGYDVKFIKKDVECILLNRSVQIYTHTHFYRDGKTELYGFIDYEVYSAFILLIKAQGVGPQKALIVLNNISPKILLTSILNEDISTLKTYGLTNKMSERLIFELKSKIKNDSKNDGGETKLLNILLGLGYSNKDARDGIDNIKNTSAPVEKQLKEVFKYFLKNKI